MEEKEELLLKNLLLKYSKENIIISTKLLFNNNLKLMNDLNIKDFYNLFDLIAKYFEKNNFNLTIKPITKPYLHNIKISRPHLLFGQMTHQKQIENFIKIYNPSDKKEFRNSYLKKYGYINALAGSICDDLKVPNSYKTYSKEILTIKLLEEYHKNNDHKLSMTEISLCENLPGYCTIKKHFNNIYLKEIWKEVLSYEINNLDKLKGLRN